MHLCVRGVILGSTISGVILGGTIGCVLGIRVISSSSSRRGCSSISWDTCYNGLLPLASSLSSMLALNRKKCMSLTKKFTENLGMIFANLLT
jgi:uncharacterized membrane protein